MNQNTLVESLSWISILPHWLNVDLINHELFQLPVIIQTKSGVTEESSSVCTFDLLLSHSGNLPQLLLLLIPSLIAEPSFPRCHCRLGTNKSPGTLQASATWLGMLSHPALWTGHLTVVTTHLCLMTQP